MSTDEHARPDAAMDDRLTQAGARWRAANGAAAEVDFAELPAPGDEPFEVLTTPAADAPTPRRHRTRLWLAASVGVAATVAASVLIVQLGGTSGNGTPHPAIGSSGSQLSGIDWTLAEIEFGSKPITASGAASVRVDGDQVRGNDGCNHFGGTISVFATTLTIGDLATTAMGCLDPSVGQTTEAVHAVLTGTVDWSVAADTLTITKAGIGSLTYQAVRHTTTTDPKALAGTNWQLTTISTGTSADSAAATPAAPATLQFEGSASASSIGVSGSDGCNGLFVKVAVGSGTMTITDIGGTQGACTGQLEAQSVSIRAILQGSSTWMITDDQLTITKDGVGALVFAQRDLDPGFTGSSGSSAGTPSPTTTK